MITQDLCTHFIGISYFTYMHFYSSCMCCLYFLGTALNCSVPVAGEVSRENLLTQYWADKVSRHYCNTAPGFLSLLTTKKSVRLAALLSLVTVVFFLFDIGILLCSSQALLLVARCVWTVVLLSFPWLIKQQPNRWHNLHATQSLEKRPLSGCLKKKCANM